MNSDGISYILYVNEFWNICIIYEFNFSHKYLSRSVIVKKRITIISEYWITLNY